MKLFLMLAVICICDVSSKILPDYVPQCKRKDPEFVKCVLSAVEKIRPYLVKGIPQIKVPPYEPLVIPHLTVDRDLEAIKIKAKMTNVKTYGPSTFRIKNLKIDLNKYTAELSVALPHLYVTSDYDVQGRLLLIPLGGKGIMEGNFTDCSGFVKGGAKVVKKKGIEYLQVEKLSSKVKIGNGRVRFVDKDGQTAVVAETAATFFNANPRLVLDIINPIIEDTANVIITTYTNRIFGTIPLSELILED